MIDKVAACLAEEMNGGMFNSPTFYNGEQQELWRERARKMIAVMCGVSDEENKNDAIPPRPWRIVPDDEFSERCWGIVDANGKSVVVTDSGFYPPDHKTAEFIIAAINSYLLNEPPHDPNPARSP